MPTNGIIIPANILTTSRVLWVCCVFIFLLLVITLILIINIAFKNIGIFINTIVYFEFVLKMGKYNLQCIYCDKPIEKFKGKEVIRCNVCNNTVHEKHTEECSICNQITCMNDIIITKGQTEGICKKCSKGNKII